MADRECEALKGETARAAKLFPAAGSITRRRAAGPLPIGYGRRRGSRSAFFYMLAGPPLTGTRGYPTGTRVLGKGFSAMETRGSASSKAVDAGCGLRKLCRSGFRKFWPVELMAQQWWDRQGPGAASAWMVRRV